MSSLKKSWVWDHFSENGKSSAFCTVCKKEIARPGGATSAMSNHLFSQHGLKDPNMKKEAWKSSTADGQNMAPTSSNVLKRKHS